MNSKNVLFIAVLFLFAACGVKAPPLKHPETIVDSYVQNYTGDKELTPEEIERTSIKAPINVNENLAEPEKDKK